MTTPTAKPGRSNHHTHVSTNTTPRRSRLLRCRPLTSADFAPFGDVISATEAERRGLGSVEANQGTARKWVDVTTVYDFYDGVCESGREAKVVVNMFVCQPRQLEKRDGGKMVFPVRVLERHPFTAQMFVPVGVSEKDTSVRYLVIVAPTLPSSSDSTCSSTATSTSRSDISTRKGPGPPDLDNIEAFLATGDQAVTYVASTWHAPMVVLGERRIDFVVVQYANGVGLEDCQEFHFDAGMHVGVDVGDEDVLRSKL